MAHVGPRQGGLMGGLRASSLVIAAALLAGCGSTTAELPVHTSYSRTAAFSQWATFRIASDGRGGSAHSYPRYEQMVRQALVDELSARGYARIEDGSPDFRVGFELSFRGDSAAQMTPDMGSADPTRRAPAGSNPEGTLAIRMLDPHSAEVLWEGTVSDFTVSAVEPQQSLRKVVWRVLAEFPPVTG
jgi:hypothetical protein